MGRIDWSDDAIEDLHAIGDVAVCAELMDLAETELAWPAGSSDIEGLVKEYPLLRWRRGVRRSDISQFLSYDIDDEEAGYSGQAWDYMIVYRRVTRNEKFRFGRSHDHYVVVRVLHNREVPPRMTIVTEVPGG